MSEDAFPATSREGSGKVCLVRRFVVAEPDLCEGMCEGRCGDVGDR